MSAITKIRAALVGDPLDPDHSPDAELLLEGLEELGNFDAGDPLSITVMTTPPVGEGDEREEIFFYRPAASWQTADGIPGTGHDEYSSIYFGPPHVGGQNSVHVSGTGHSSTLETYFNLGYGAFALYEVTSGSYCCAFGHEALRENTVGAWNTAFGEAAGCNNAAGDASTWVGWKTGLGLAGITDTDRNVGIGYFALGHVGVGGTNVAIGYSCMGISGVTVEADTISGGFNVALGAQIAVAATSANRNLLAGHAAGGAITTAGFNIALGFTAAKGLTTGDNNIVIGLVDLTSTPTQHDTLTIANPGTGAHYIYADATSWQVRSGTSGAITTGLEVMRNVSSAVNYVRITPAATGNGAIVGTFGTDAAVNLLFQTRQSSAQATRMTLGLGLQIGSPTGGDKGTGTINVSGDIYKNNTAYTNPDYVFEHYYEGKVVRFAKKPGAANYNGLMPLDELREHTRKNLRLPGITDEASGMFERADTVLEKAEESTLYILGLHDRIKRLEALVETLAKAA